MCDGQFDAKYCNMFDKNKKLIGVNGCIKNTLKLKSDVEF